MRDAVALESRGCGLHLSGRHSARRGAMIRPRRKRQPSVLVRARICDGQVRVFHDLVNLTFGPRQNSFAATETSPPLSRNGTAFQGDIISRQFSQTDASRINLPNRNAGRIDTYFAASTLSKDNRGCRVTTNHRRDGCPPRSVPHSSYRIAMKSARLFSEARLHARARAA